MYLKKVPIKIKSIVFDLDGTLIDSSPSILASISSAFEQLEIQPTRQLSQDLIGPPLAETLANLLSAQHIGRLPELMEKFKKKYDESGYRNTIVYKGVPTMLQRLYNNKLNMYIATNKRLIPTNRIVNYLGWDGFFKKIYTLDKYSPPLLKKATMLQHVHDDLSIGSREIVYVGDRLEDAEAAKNCGLYFLWAEWGYGRESIPMGTINTLKTPDELLFE